MTFDVTAVRDQFPALTSGVAYFDGPGGTQTPAAVGEAIARTITGPLSNVGTITLGERRANASVSGFRSTFADLLGVAPASIVHGRSATQLTYDIARALAKDWGPGDEVVVSRLDHDCNVRPWVQAAERAAATLRWLRLDPATAELDLGDLDEVVNERTRLVAVTAASNLLGTKPPVARIAERAHAVGALTYVDGVHYAAHSAVDVAALGADFFVCSPYKFFGPHCGVLAADPALLDTLAPDKLAPSPDTVPERFEYGTLPYEILAGATANVDFIAGLAPDGDGRRERLRAAHEAIDRHELRLRRRIEDGLAGFGDRDTPHSRAADRTPTLLVTFAGREPFDAYRFLAERDIAAPAGTFYAYEPARVLGLDAGLRVGLAPYNDDAEIDRLLTALEDFLG